ncbi:MAG: hypothetical protein A3J38_04250 [Gammaproteobacteria bacterium RIFCSPHIGHO2_12_FULL_45_9]|nr:MAG: hypothetical protein A3J38_04250 [Gammaproteobacteria bacterium RIFCSPHIGHO2_12_FULL_45_9]
MVIRHKFFYLNLFTAVAVLGIVNSALFWQFWYHDLPCPLCLLQRIGFAAVGIGFWMNTRFGDHPTHYGIALIGALYTLAAAGRQMLLHIAPGTGSYGDPLFGLHLYTWSVITALLLITWSAVLLLLHSSGTAAPSSHAIPPHFAKSLVDFLLVLTILLLLGNALSTLWECGFYPCPDNPTHYKW